MSSGLFAFGLTFPNFFSPSFISSGPEAGNASNEKFSNNENKEEPIFISKKTKCTLSEDPIETIDLHFKNLEKKIGLCFIK